MAKAVRLARLSEGRTAPNPPVGAVVVNDGAVVGQGRHLAAGKPHAEAVALEQAGEKSKGATLYVTLEPCNHHGRTPPCTDRIIAAGISRVVIGQPDPNPRVAGKGAKRLQEAGISVNTGVVEDKCIELLNPFLSLTTTGRPWVCLKMAASLDGRVGPGPGMSVWLTGEKARAWTHRLRDRSEAILVGRATVAADDPALTTRLPRTRGQNPLRVVLDSSLSLDPAARVVSGPKEGGPAGGGCLVLTTTQAPAERRARLKSAGAEVKTLSAGLGGLDLEAVLDELGQRGVMRLLVEGGPELTGRFVRAGLVDEVFFLLAPVIIGGRNAPGVLAGPNLLEMSEASRLSEIKTRRLGPDLLVAARLNRPPKGSKED